MPSGPGLHLLIFPPLFGLLVYALCWSQYPEGVHWVRTWGLEGCSYWGIQWHLWGGQAMKLVHPLHHIHPRSGEHNLFNLPTALCLFLLLDHWSRGSILGLFVVPHYMQHMPHGWCYCQTQDLHRPWRPQVLWMWCRFCWMSCKLWLLMQMSAYNPIL